MSSPVRIGLKQLTNELDFIFFVCDESAVSIKYASTSFLRMMRMTARELRKTPRHWMTRINDTEQNIINLLRPNTMGEGDFQLDLPFCLDHCDIVYVQFRYSAVQHIHNKKIRFGSIIFPSIDDLYKKEALQSRDNEIEISARIQKTLLTGEINNTRSDLVIAAETLPSSKVDGDFYDFLWLTPRIADFLIGDVMGKGVPAALLGAGVKSSFFKSLITLGSVVGELPEIRNVLGLIEKSMSKDLMELEKFLTLYYCRLDMEKSLLSFIDAGHTCFIYHDASDKSCWSIKGANMPLGFALNQEFMRFLIPLNKGDLLFFYSDGISEVADTEGELFGEERIMQLINAHHHLEPEELIKKVLNVTFFFAANDFEDDVTAISIKIKKEREHPAKIQSRHYDRTSEVDLTGIREDFSNDMRDEYGSSYSLETTKLLIAFMEVLANCITHTESNLDIQWKILSREVNVTVSYVGGDYNWFTNPEPHIESYQQNGYGSYLIREGTDSALLLYGRNDRKRIVLIKEMI